MRSRAEHPRRLASVAGPEVCRRIETGEVGSLRLALDQGQGAIEWRVLPLATAPTAENHWVETGPHVMVVGADPGFYDQYPKDAQPDTAVPYVMWPGTPYQHLMVPVK